MEKQKLAVKLKKYKNNNLRERKSLYELTWKVEEKASLKMGLF